MPTPQRPIATSDARPIPGRVSHPHLVTLSPCHPYPPPPLCCIRFHLVTDEAGERRSRGEREMDVASVGKPPSWQSTARPDRTRTGQVQTISSQVRTFSRHLERFFVAVARRNRDIRLEMRVADTRTAARFGWNRFAGNNLGEISRRGAEAQSKCMLTTDFTDATDKNDASLSLLALIRAHQRPSVVKLYLSLLRYPLLLRR